ncbi:MAG TPA: hypothetical protein VI541_04865 [Actinomycetota bacterium]|nr:hypothetical protein [Actinomycetota bacterium]
MDRDLDRKTTEHILSGAADEVEGFEGLIALVSAISTPTSPEASSREVQIVDQIVRAVHAPDRRRQVLKGSMRWKLSAVTVGGLLALMTGLAFAGSLPGAAQDVASEMLSKVGITVPASDHANYHSQTRGKSGDAHGTESDSHGKGFDVTSTVNSTSPGLERGKAVSDVASDGKSVTGTANAQDHAVTGTANSNEHRPSPAP